MKNQSTHLYALSILSGILIGTSYIPFPPWALLFGLVPLWLAWIKCKSIWQIFLTGWITQFVLSLIGFNWVAHTLFEFGNFTKLISYVGLVLFAAFANIYIPLAGVAWAYIHKKLFPNSSLNFRSSLPSLLMLIALFSLSEIYLVRIFPWSYSYPLLAVKSYTYNLAEYIGFEGLSTLVIASNVFFLKIFISYKSCKKKSFMWLTALALFIISTHSLGFVIQKNQKPPKEKIQVLIVQANIGNSEKIEAEKNLHEDKVSEFILNTYAKQTSEALKTRSYSYEKTFVIWPETAVSAIMGKHKKNIINKKVLEYVKKENIYLITGGYGFDKKQKKYLNSIYFIGPEGYEDKSYDKHKLLIFGEYLPFGEYFPKLYQMFPQAGNFAAGAGPSVKTLGSVKFGPQICYEGLFPDLSLQAADKGAQILVNLTNDSWFGDWQEPEQHLYMTLARSIEIRKPLIRSANTGFSAVMLADGTLFKSPLLHKAGHQFIEVSYNKDQDPTFFQKFPWVNKTVLFLVFIISLSQLILVRPHVES